MDEALDPMEDTLTESSELQRAALEVTLSADKAAFSATDDVTLTVTVRNTGRHTVKLFKWNTVADGIEEPVLAVTREGRAVEFTGPHYKRPAAREVDMVRLAPGESLTRTVSLSEVYDLSQTGQYSVRYEGLRSNEVSFQAEGRKSPGSQAAGSVCTATQASTLAQALSAAGGMANNSVTYLNGSPAATPRYVTWFGTFSTSGWNTAKTHFVAIKEAIDNNRVTFNCSCKKNYYAYVYPAQPYVVYPCNVFWTAPMTGTDSKGGTLIHEISHFNVVAATDDWAYGQSAAKSLAISDPTKALNNADNHEYFAENTPFLQ